MTQLRAFGLEISFIVLVWFYLQCLSTSDFNIIAIQTYYFPWIVCEEANRVEVQVQKDLRPNTLIPEVGFEAQFFIGFDRI